MAIDDKAEVLDLGCGTGIAARAIARRPAFTIFDGDYASMTFELADERRAYQMDEAIIGSLVTNPRILRQLPRLLKWAGFKIDAVMPSIITEVGEADFWKSGIEAYAKLAPRAGILTGHEVTEWLDELLDASAKGVFFGSCVYYAYVAHAV